MTALPELTSEQMKQFWLIYKWHLVCEKGQFEIADRIYETLRHIWNER